MIDLIEKWVRSDWLDWEVIEKVIDLIEKWLTWIRSECNPPRYIAIYCAWLTLSDNDLGIFGQSVCTGCALEDWKSVSGRELQRVIKRPSIRGKEWEIHVLKDNDQINVDESRKEIENQFNWRKRESWVLICIINVIIVC